MENLKDEKIKDLEKRQYYKKAIKYMTEHNIKMTDYNIDYYRRELLRGYNRNWENEHKEERRQYFKEYYATHPRSRKVEDIKNEKTLELLKLKKKLS